MPADATLHGYGRVDWDTARALLDGCACAWTDIDGVHLRDTPPRHLPTGASHLWGWSADRLARVRFDTGTCVEAGTVYVATLTLSGHGAAPGARLSERVTYERRATILRPADDERAGPLPPEFYEYAWELFEVPGEAPITFVRAKP